MNPTPMLHQRTAIVTGAGGGLGRAHALELARRGARVLVNDLDAESAQAVASEIVEMGGEALPFACSVTDRDAVAAMVAFSHEQWGRVDILVNNAGILRDKSFAKMPLDDFALVVAVHLMGAATCTRAVWNIMREQGYGRIILTSSSSGLYGNFGQANYGAAKMALVGLMQTLAIEGAKSDIRVNCLAPTAATGMTGDIWTPEALAHLDPALVSPAVAFLASEDAPTRAILCAGAGHFSTANITLGPGYFVGGGENAAEELARNWGKASSRAGEIVPTQGFAQVEREIAAAGGGPARLTLR